MCRKHLQIILFFVLIFSFCSAAQAFTTLPPAKKPIPVDVSFYVNDILALIETNETMRFVGILTLRWQDKRLAFRPDATGTRVKNYGTRAAEKLLETIWYPQVGFVRSSGPRQIQMRHVSITRRGFVTLTEKFLVTVEIPMDLRKFPFDKQVVQIALQPFINDATEVQLRDFPKLSGIAKKAYVRGMSAVHFDSRITKVIDPIYQKPFSQYNFIIQHSRISMYYIYQIFIPIVLIVLLSFSVFWMMHNPLVNRVAISFTALLTIVVFQWQALSKLPHVTYHTFLDVFMLVSFAITVSTILASVVIEHLEQSKDSWVRACRIAYPLFYVFAVLCVLFIYR